MTIDLDELTREATAAKDIVESWQILAPPTWLNGRCAPSTVLALIERVRGLEARHEAASQWRCDGCSGVERPNDGRRPDRHNSCGGMWIREERTG